MIVNFAELDEVRTMLLRLQELEPEHSRELTALRDTVWFGPGRLDQVRSYVATSIAQRGWSWEAIHPGVVVHAGASDFVAVPGEECPRGMAHALLNAYVGAMEAVEDE